MVFYEKEFYINSNYIFCIFFKCFAVVQQNGMKQISTEKDGDWMAMAAAGRVRMDMCSSLVCLDANNGYRMEGRIYHNNFGGTREYAPKSVFDREGRVS